MHLLQHVCHDASETQALLRVPSASQGDVLMFPRQRQACLTHVNAIAVCLVIEVYSGSIIQGRVSSHGI